MGWEFGVILKDIQEEIREDYSLLDIQLGI